MIAAILVSCSVEDETVQPKAGPKNCLIIILDASRADFLSSYGYPEQTTPFIDSLAREGVLFEHAYAQETRTIHSVASYFTGKYVRFLDSPSEFRGVNLRAPSLPKLFSERDFRTSMFSTNPFLSSSFGFATGFEVFRNFDFHGVANRSKDSDRYFRDSSSTQALVGSFRQWLSTVEDDAWFSYLHILRPHTPYVTEEKYMRRFVDLPDDSTEELTAYAKRIEDAYRWEVYPVALGGWKARVEISDADTATLRDLYAANLNHVDDAVKEILAAVAAIGDLEETLVVVASDHGEAFGEHNRYFHSAEPHESLIHVPLILSGLPGIPEGGRRVEAPVEMVDLLPTLTDLFNLEPVPGIDGRSLLPMISGENQQAKPYCIAQSKAMNAVMVRSGPMKLIGTFPRQAENNSGKEPEWELYDIVKDPLELRNIIDSSQWASELARLKTRALAYYAASIPTRKSKKEPILSEEQEEALRSLGYVE